MMRRRLAATARVLNTVIFAVVFKRVSFISVIDLLLVASTGLHFSFMDTHTYTHKRTHACTHTQTLIQASIIIHTRAYV